MTEKQFAERVAVELRDKLQGYDVKTGKSILYKLMIDPDGRLSPSNYSNPTRGDLAFETDILVEKGGVPLVVIETKVHNPTTHDILIYSTKGLKHKEVYPYLRYGLLILSDHERIATKFFTHNTGFDFALAVNDSNDWSNELVAVVRDQIGFASLLQSALKKYIVRGYVTKVELITQKG